MGYRVPIYKFSNAFANAQVDAAKHQKPSRKPIKERDRVMYEMYGCKLIYLNPIKNDSQRILCEVEFESESHYLAFVLKWS